MLTIRPARPADLPALLPMVQALALHHGDQPCVSLTTLNRDLFGPYPWALALVAERDSALVGYAILARSVQLQFAKRRMDLHHLFIADTHRSKGIGTALVQAAVARAQAEGCAWITVGTAPNNPQAAAFYPKQGFEPYTPHGARFWLNLDTDTP